MEILLNKITSMHVKALLPSTWSGKKFSARKQSAAGRIIDARRSVKSNAWHHSETRVGGDGILQRMQVTKSRLYRVRTDPWGAYKEDWSTWGGLPVTKNWETLSSLVLFATRILDDTAIYPLRRSRDSIGDKPPSSLSSSSHWFTSLMTMRMRIEQVK